MSIMRLLKKYAGKTKDGEVRSNNLEADSGDGQTDGDRPQNLREDNEESDLQYSIDYGKEA